MDPAFKNFISAFSPPVDLIKPTDQTISQFEKVLPISLINFWKEYGFGNYADGLIKVINPEEYNVSLYEWLGKKDISRVPILVTAFGDIFFYRKLTASDEDISFLDIHYRKIEVCVWSLIDFFNSFIVNNDIIKELLREKLFKKAVSKIGTITFDEIYYFVPALILGGKEDIKNISKGNGIIHQSLLFQTGN
ncbi:MAG: DUF1851 domain-containing protein [Deltaproteobacteria bacterium]|jgi:hypothetical protein|nr:DUF1851 domain-containing protein [Deltaproteobacteria bacterium]